MKQSCVFIILAVDIICADCACVDNGAVQRLATI